MDLEATTTVPRPICARCKRPVDEFIVTVEEASVKFEAKCHGAYEMNRLFERDQVTGVRMTEAFQ